MVKLETTEQLIAQLFDNQPDSVVWFQPVYNEDLNTVVDFEAHYCNRAAAQILGVPQEDVIGSRLAAGSLMDEISRRKILEQCLQVWQSEKPIEFTYFSPGMDKYFNVQRSKVVNGILSITRDRTLEIKSELQLKEQEKRYQQIIDTSSDGVLVLDAIRNAQHQIIDFRIAYCNRKGFENGSIPLDAIGKNITEVLPLTSEQLQPHKEVTETGIPTTYETSFTTPDGKHYGWFIISLTKYGDGVVSRFIDITDRKKNENKIAEQKKQLNDILDASINAVFACEAIRNEQGNIIDLRFIQINKMYKQMIGKTDEEVVGKTMLEIFPTAKPAGAFDLHCQVIETGVPARFEVRYEGDGLDAWFDTSSIKVDDGVVVTFADVTKEKKAQLELKNLVEQLQRSNKNLEEFAYAASHDLQEPLRKISFFSESLKRDLATVLTEDSEKKFQRMLSATTRMKKLIDDLLAYSRLSVKPETLEEVELDDVVQMVLQDLETSINESSARFELGRLPKIRGDERQLRQMFQNLFSNAIKYRKANTSPHVVIKSGTVKPGDSIFEQLPRVARASYHLIEVSDNGIGFEQEHAEKIFQVFQRLHGQAEYEGTGVGLAIVQKVVSNHKGYVAAISELDKGARFLLFFPT